MKVMNHLPQAVNIRWDNKQEVIGKPYELYKFSSSNAQRVEREENVIRILSKKGWVFE